METDYLLQDQATEIFGKDLAESLKIRDGSWKKVMESWNISLQAWKIIKESENDLSSLPKYISCEEQVNYGLIFITSESYTEEKEITAGKIVTPHGSIDLKFHNTESRNQFIARFERTFCTQAESTSYETCYAFSLDRTKRATVKPRAIYDPSRYALREELGKNYYSRTEALNVYKILSCYSGITIEGQAINHNIC